MKFGIFGINSNDAESYPGDSPEKMKEEAATWGYRFPYLIDADQSVANAYRAACTPDFFLFDENLKLVYRGQLDGSRPANEVPSDGSDIRMRCWQVSRWRRNRSRALAAASNGNLVTRLRGLARVESISLRLAMRDLLSFRTSHQIKLVVRTHCG